jgi:SAM-dependent methyltransferase
MTPLSTIRTVSRYYDYIYLWAQWTSRFRAFSSAGPHPIHRALTDPDTGAFHADVVHDLIARELAGRAAPPTGLDAGCGYGGTLIAMHQRCGGTWHGVTINQRQAEIGRRNIGNLGLSAALTVDHASYDDPLPARFDVIVAIESLVHSADPARTIANLAGALLPGGLFVMIDDMPVEPFPPEQAGDLDGFKRGWKCPVAPSAAEWTALLAGAGCAVVSSRDLTPYTAKRPPGELELFLVDTKRRRRWRDRIGLKLVSDGQEGGLLLERLLLNGALHYRMLVARKA